jgi:hypothetical protein
VENSIVNKQEWPFYHGTHAVQVQWYFDNFGIYSVNMKETN